MVFDDTYSCLINLVSLGIKLGVIRPKSSETIPTNSSGTRDNPATSSYFPDADHAGCKVARRSHTGFSLFKNRSPIVCYSKHQNTVDNSTFGSKCLGMRQSVDLIGALMYKIRMMGIPLDGITSLWLDPKSYYVVVTML